MNVAVKPEMLALQRLYHWEATTPDKIALTQPMGGGVVRDFTWREVLDQTRRIAAHLKSLDLPAGSRIAILSKNTAWWLMADYAIWMAGHVSVPLYPTLAAGSVRKILEHSEARVLILGKLDDWSTMRAGVPPGLPCIATPLAPAGPFESWDDSRVHHLPFYPLYLR